MAGASGDKTKRDRNARRRFKVEVAEEIKEEHDDKNIEYCGASSAFGHKLQAGAPAFTIDHVATHDGRDVYEGFPLSPRVSRQT